MSEAELHILKQRMLEGKRAKAQRGELGMRPPMGYVRQHPSGQIVKDPDEQARAVIELIFEVFARTGTLHAVLRHLVDRELHMPCRVASGPTKGELEWRRPNRVTLSNLLHNPIYAGAYAYGRRPIDARKKIPGRPSTGRTVAAPEEWEVLLKDRLPAYISWEQFDANLRQLQANTAQALGVARQGPSLLSGLLVCGRCGLRMVTQYNHNGRGLRYVCNRMATDYGEPVCQSLAGAPLDQRTAEQVLQALEPAALAISLEVAEDLEGEREQHRAHWEKRLERARFEAERAQRQYNAVEPENRLVARTLERQWEQALANLETLTREYAQFQERQPSPLSAAERHAIHRLANDIPALWSAPTTTPADRQRIVRLLLKRVIVSVIDDTEKVNVEYHWAGGHRTRAQLIRPVGRIEQLSYYPALLTRVTALYQEVPNAAEIAQVLNQEGWRPAKRRDTFNAAMVSALLARQGLRTGSSKQQVARTLRRHPDEWTLKELAGELRMPEITLYTWLRRGRLNARQEEQTGRSLWLIQADKAELERLRALRKIPRRWAKSTPAVHAS